MRLFAGDIGITEVGITAICLLYVIKLLLDYFGKNKSKNDNGVGALAESNFRREVYTMIGLTKDLHDWHNVNDADGRKIWYVKASLEESINDSTKATRENTSTLKELIGIIKTLEG